MKTFAVWASSLISGLGRALFVYTASVMLMTCAVEASSITFQGSFIYDNDNRVFTLVVDQSTNIEIKSVGYAGDPYSDLGVIPSGGFDSYLTIFDSAGQFVAENDDGDDSAIDPTTGQGFDAHIQQSLDPGTYSVWLTQSGNYALGLNDYSGFSQDGNPDYTTVNNLSGVNCSSGLFEDASGSPNACRNGNYALEFLDLQGASASYSILDSTDGSEAPEPATWCTAAFALGLVVIRSRWQARKVSCFRVT